MTFFLLYNTINIVAAAKKKLFLAHKSIIEKNKIKLFIKYLIVYQFESSEVLFNEEMLDICIPPIVELSNFRVSVYIQNRA